MHVRRRAVTIFKIVKLLIPCVVLSFLAAGRAQNAKGLLEPAGASPGLCVVLGDPRAALELARGTDLRVYVQAADAKEVESLRKAAEDAALLGTKLFVQKGSLARLHLADNLADAVIVLGDAGRQTNRADLF